MSSGRRDGFCNDTNKSNTESPIVALIFRIGNYKKARIMNVWEEGRGGAYAVFKKIKSYMLLMGQEVLLYDCSVFLFLVFKKKFNGQAVSKDFYTVSGSPWVRFRA